MTTGRQPTVEAVTKFAAGSGGSVAKTAGGRLNAVRSRYLPWLDSLWASLSGRILRLPQDLRFPADRECGSSHRFARGLQRDDRGSNGGHFGNRFVRLVAVEVHLVAISTRVFQVRI
jgi:hypothetical protein